LLGVDAAAIAMPDERRELLVTRALHVADRRLDAPARALLARPQPLSGLPIQRLFWTSVPVMLDAATVSELGGSLELLVPFFEKGSTAAFVPIATPAEVLATLVLLSLDPTRPVDREIVETAVSVGAQAALAIDNARLYQQQKHFSDTMQRSLLPRSQPDIAGLELGDVYESSARVDVGGDLYDFLTLPDGRLAVVLGDVTGHGIDAAADMAMAKFVFRSLAREHPEPSDFLAAANEVVEEEIAPGKFITMLYLTIDCERGELSCASAGHPAPRLLFPDGRVTPIGVHGLALGVERAQSYEQVSVPFPLGAAVTLYTDGVVEARRDGELYGEGRLDRALVANGARAAPELAEAIVADCRAFGGGELSDDCAVVVIRRREPSEVR
ncbi:MAG: SpoIIE family protein phosphatase, partial [Actinomycetota bacterium]|nr:SpoIIE family protein phosphatase [Actinomycetota bacterium]